MLLTDEIVLKARANSAKAVDFTNVVVVLNVPNIIDMRWLESNTLKNNIKSVLYSWQGGMEGGNALADVLSGKVTPSGKLTDTIAYRLEDYPASANFGSDVRNIYAEDIYVGYRYFETFNKGAVQFPFGFGLSYTNFNIETISSVINTNIPEGELVVNLKVTNIGSTYSGREVVQLYYSAPQGLLGKPSLELGAFKKSRELAPGEFQNLELVLPLSRMASYDDIGVTGYKSSYVLEKGEYNFFVGNSVRNLEKLSINNYSFSLSENILTSKLEEALTPNAPFKRMKPGVENKNGDFSIDYELTPEPVVSLKERMDSRIPRVMDITGDRDIKLTDVKKGKFILDEFIAQLSQKELEIIVRGEGMSSPKVTSGTAGAFGGVGDSLIKYGIPVACVADGPSGIRRENDIDALLGPGMNIHRHPLNGRNFEYFSEDPYLTGVMASAITLGVEDGGSTGTVKHFACNDQEYKRDAVDSVVSERALREIHLKAFEIVVKEGSAKSIMTSYNPINGIWAASNYDLNTTILRGEWGFSGIVMTDWWAKMNDPITGGESSMKNTSCMVRAQNDLYMLVNNYGAEVNGLGDNLSQTVASGDLTIGELQRCAKNICRFLLDTKALERPVKKLQIKVVEPKEGEGAEFNTDSEIVLNTINNATVSFFVDCDGEYSMVVDMLNPNEPAAQSSCNVILNSTLVTNIQLNGTRGVRVRQKDLNIRLSKGIYTVDLSFTKPGLEICSLSFNKN